MNFSATPWLNKFEKTYYRCGVCDHIYVLVGECIVTQSKKGYSDGTFFLVEGNENYYFSDNNIVSMRQKLRWVTKFYKGRGRLLDAGAGFGYFLSILPDQLDAQGIDISSYAVEWSKKKFCINNTAASIEDLQTLKLGLFDVITMWDVIEHLFAWRMALKNIVSSLKPGGLLFFTTPETSSITAHLLGRHWYHLYPMQHLNLFNKTNLLKILDCHGLEVVAIRHWGRYYNISYVLNRLSSFYLNHPGNSKKAARIIRKIPGFIGNSNFYFSLGDIIGICARKKT